MTIAHQALLGPAADGPRDSTLSGEANAVGPRALIRVYGPRLGHGRGRSGPNSHAQLHVPGEAAPKPVAHQTWPVPPVAHLTEKARP